MTRSIIKIKTTLLDHQIAQLSAVAIGLSLIESVLPSPMPGVKPGIANIITLYALYRFSFKTAVWVSILRVFATSLILGQFLSPTFMLSLTGSILSLLTLYIGIKLPSKIFSPLSLSILSSFAHIAGQLILVRLWLIPHASIYYLIPIYSAAALLFGFINGWIAYRLLKQHNSI
ncbi:Gx transporter family protein [Candidatus Methylopumilus planktonicus]|jgi:heptaprenyl diphosphate synthase|uniref:Gx transporter family protein n=1 Tax=Candidatus Methylopumilus planktonicus TaxID=1581557 RepID=UPI001121AF10|nr:Gx transporter family protein [Candidatus Methylopumilus planktonicus]QDD11429.1 Gx transporter family protein [Candidatus Methylopumilus planktonicus]QDD23900.1 Gx transporter family protein [Candidatus Methylopumilus planktonicus]